MMKTLLIIFILPLLTIGGAIASAFVTLGLEKDGELKIVNNKTQAAFIEYGDKNYGRVKYTAAPGLYTVTGAASGCPPIVQSSTFEEGKAYNFVLTRDCKIKDVTF